MIKKLADDYIRVALSHFFVHEGGWMHARARKNTLLIQVVRIWALKLFYLVCHFVFAIQILFMNHARAVCMHFY